MQRPAKVNLTRRRVITISAPLAAASWLGLSLPARAQTFARRPVRFIVPCGAGGGLTNIVPRLLAERLTAAPGQPVLVENRAGGLGIPAINEVRAQPADGHTILVADASHWVTNPNMQRMPFNFVQDVVPLTRTYTAKLALVVSGTSPIKNLDALVALAKANPGSVNYASGGIGTIQQLQSEVLAHGLGVKFTHVPYKSAAEVQEALMRGDVHFAFLGLAGVLPLLPSGRLRALALSSRTRSPVIPDLPTVGELTGLKDFEWATDQALFVRSQTPPAVWSSCTTRWPGRWRSRSCREGIGKRGRDQADHPGAVGGTAAGGPAPLSAGDCAGRYQQRAVNRGGRQSE